MKRRVRTRPLRGRAGACVVAAAWCAFCPPVRAADSQRAPSAGVEFDPALLFKGQGIARDLSRFRFGNPVEPGTYRADVFLNGSNLGRMDVRLTQAAGQASVALPCLDAPLLARLGLDPAKVGPEARRLLEADRQQMAPGACVRVAEVSPDASATYQINEQRLDLSVPQLVLKSVPKGYVPPDEWETGINAGLLTYRFNSFIVDSGGARTSSNDLGLTAGLNVNGWMFRHDGNLDATDRTTYHSTDTTLRRDLPSLRAGLTVGDGTSDGQVFDSIGFRGVMLATDDRMLAPSQRNYAPSIRGVARTNASVTVTQNGVLLYKTTVPPGPFSIDDLYPPGTGGNLLITVTEADGTERSFSLPYFASVQLLREHALRYQAVLGTVRGPGMPSRESMALATAQYGVGEGVTLLGGGLAAAHYSSALGGIAVATPVGAIAAKVGLADFDSPTDGPQQGANFETTYAVVVPRALTNISLDVTRGSTRHAYTFRDAMVVLGGPAPVPGVSPMTRVRSRESVNISQPLHGGTLVASAMSESFWDQTQRITQYQIGYSWSVGRSTAHVALSRGSINGVADTQASLWFNVPLGMAADAGTLGLNLANDSRTGVTAQTTYSNAIGARRALTYTLQSSAASGGEHNIGGYATWNTPVAILTASTTDSPASKQWSLGASGGVILHAGGLTFGPPLGDTVGLIHAPAAVGVPVLNGQESRVDKAGYAVVPWLSPYTRDEVGLDVSGASLDVDLDATQTRVVPRAGAVVMIPFTGRTSRWILIRAVRADGSSLPFGADVYDKGGEQVGNVGQGGRVNARVEADSGWLSVRWGDAPSEACRLPYTLPDRNPDRFVQLDGLRCEPIPAAPVATAGH